LSKEELTKGYHLACLTRIQSDVEVTVPIESLREKPSILLTGKIPPHEVKPLSKKYLVDFSSYPKGNSKESLVNGIRKIIGLPKVNIDDSVKADFPAIEDVNVLTVTINTVTDTPEIIQVNSGDNTKNNFGLAIDVGTTTVVVYLVDLISGDVIDQDSTLNKQITYGEELISRIGYAKDESGLLALQEATKESINLLIKRLTTKHIIEYKDITDVSVGANTVMNHFLVGLNTNYLNYADARVTRNPITRKASTLGILAHPKANVYCLPNVSRFLGGDAIGDILATGMHELDDVSLMIDMGTNGEVIFGNKVWLFSCSVPSGPAYEGSGLKFGMRGMKGAIDHVQVHPDTYMTTYTVIGNTPPKGICGSGIIDIMAEMYSVGILDRFGKIRKKDTPLIREGAGGLEFLVVESGKTEINRDIVVNQKDLDYMMDSKATLCGGISTLMKKLRLSIYDVKRVFLAGAYGRYMIPQNAMKIGVFPEFPNAHVSSIGNGSVIGAYLTLLSSNERSQAKEIARKMAYIDLLVDPDFMEDYEAAFIIPGKPELFPTLSKRKK
jgi:uncharacterized 2Fe-2S/4Fe-4S cluster protein (DUF4445 family)